MSDRLCEIARWQIFYVHCNSSNYFLFHSEKFLIQKSQIDVGQSLARRKENSSRRFSTDFETLSSWVLYYNEWLIAWWSWLKPRKKFDQIRKGKESFERPNPNWKLT